MNNQRGLTLIEVLAAITILSMVILAVSYLFTKGYENSYKEEKKDVSVQLARTVIEELKKNLKQTTKADMNLPTMNDQIIQLNPLRNISSASTALSTIYSPGPADQQYQIEISSLPIPNDKNTIPINDITNKSFDFNINEYFSFIEVKVINKQFNTSYVLQSYIEKR